MSNVINFSTFKATANVKKLIPYYQTVLEIIDCTDETVYCANPQYHIHKTAKQLAELLSDYIYGTDPYRRSMEQELKGEGVRYE